MKKPISLRVVTVLCWLQVALGGAMFATAVSCITSPAREGFWLGFQNAMARTLSSAANARSFGAEEFGEATAYVMISVLFPVGALISMRRKSHAGVTSCLAIAIVIAISQRSLPVLEIIALIAACRKSVKEFLADIPQKPNPSPVPTTPSSGGSA